MKLIQVRKDHDLKQVQQRLTALGLWTSLYRGSSEERLLTVEPHSSHVAPAVLEAVVGVEAVFEQRPAQPRVDAHPEAVQIGAVWFGTSEPVLMAGPCSVEGEAQIQESAAQVAGQGARVLRGGCFKPRTGPYSFQGVGAEGLSWMRAAADAHDLLVVTEAMAPKHVDVVAAHSDIFQIGARNMQNFDLLHAVGRAGMPVLLKRGLSATLEEWLQAAEHTLHAGASCILLCERGVRGFDGSTRFLFDLSAVALIRHVYKLPIIADPSHATGRKDLIGPMGAAALAAGACGLIVETHPNPAVACSDAPQQLDPAEFEVAVRQWGFGS